MPTLYDALPSLKGSEVWALGCIGAYEGNERAPRAHAKGPWNYPNFKSLGFRV